MATTPILHTDRLLLRPVTTADIAAIQRQFANWNVIRTIGGNVPWPYPDDGAQSFVEHMLKLCAHKEIYFWALCLKSRAQELVGTIEYRFSEDEDDNRGFWLAEQHWNRGLMTEAVVATQDFVFFELRVPRLLVSTRRDNLGSVAIKEKTGARRVGTRREEYPDGMKDQDLWEITQQSWAAIRGRTL